MIATGYSRVLSQCYILCIHEFDIQIFQMHCFFYFLYFFYITCLFRAIAYSNLLCFPIREQSGILGVGLVINKIDDTYFDATDEEMVLAFSIYCGLCIVQSTMYGKLHEAHIRNALADELILYHLKVTFLILTFLNHLLVP